MHFHDYSSKDQMAMVLSASCPLHPRATLCWREAAAEAAPCHNVPNSTASEEEQVRGHGCRAPTGPQDVQGCSVSLGTDGDTLSVPCQVYTLDNVDVHPLLCFRVSPWGGTGWEGARQGAQLTPCSLRSSPMGTAATWSVPTAQVSPWVWDAVPSPSGTPSCHGVRSLSARHRLECVPECPGTAAPPAPHLPRPRVLQRSAVPAPGRAL